MSATPAEGGIVLLDPALGSELSRRGCDTSGPLWSARVVSDDIAAVTAVHREALDAGARVLTAATFRTHERNLAAGGWSGRSDELNARAIAAARKAIADAGVERIRVAGSIGPLEDSLRPDRVPGRAELGAEHAGQARSLREAGADILLVETMGTRREAAAAVMAAVATGLPTWCSFTTSAPGVLLGGEPLGEAVGAVEDLGAEVILLNCIPCASALPDLEALLEVTALSAGIYPNIGHARGQVGWRQDLSVSPEEFAEVMAACEAAGADVLGGCCGTTAGHMAAVARRQGP